MSALDAKGNRKAVDHVEACRAALERIGLAIATGAPVTLEDAKALESAGCWLRRNAVAAP